MPDVSPALGSVTQTTAAALKAAIG